MGRLRQFCTFSLGDLSFGVDILSIQEVIRHQATTPVPTASPVVRGLINLRGQVVMVIDPKARLGLPPPGPGIEPIHVIARTDDQPVGFLVDDVGDILDLPADQMATAPETIPREIRELLDGVYKLTGRLLLVLDAGRVADFDAATGPAA